MAFGLAAICYATNTITTRRLDTSDPLVSATTVMRITSATMVPAALWIDWPGGLTWSATSIASAVWLGIFATALAMILHFRIIQRAGPTFLSSINCMIPAVALTAGAIVLDEELVGAVMVGMALVLTGLAISQLGSRSGWARRSRPSWIRRSAIQTVKFAGPMIHFDSTRRRNTLVE